MVTPPLFVLGKARPVFRHRVIPIQLAPFPEDVQAYGGQRLGGRVQDEHGIGVDGRTGGIVGQAAPQVNGELAVAIDGQAGAGMEAPVDLLAEEVFQFLDGGGIHSRGVGNGGCGCGGGRGHQNPLNGAGFPLARE